MPRDPDDWEKPRSHGQRFTEAECDLVRNAFYADRPARDVARELKCATRTINFRYALLRCETPVRHRTKPRTVRKKIDKESRFYKSNFEL